MLKHLFLLFFVGWSTLASAFDNFHEDRGGNGPTGSGLTVTITVILSPSFEETTRLCGTKTAAAGCYYKDDEGNEIIVIPAAGGWDDYYSFCIAGHELYHALGANHATGVGCPYPYVDEQNVAKEKHRHTGEESKKEEKNKDKKSN
jgi:hypothetical protein